jgi:hypothetical protein
MVAGEGLALDCPADDKRFIDGFVYRWGFARSCRSPGTMAAIRRGGRGRLMGMGVPIPLSEWMPGSRGWCPPSELHGISDSKWMPENQ